MKKYFNLLLFLLLGLGSCETEEQTPDKTQVIKKEKITGFVQKGPFVSGTSILMNELNPQLVQTGKIFTSTISNDMGLFEVNNIELISSFVEITSSGFYFNEVSGEISNSQLTLTSLSDIGDKNSINVNVLTHLQKKRVETLMKEGKSFSESKIQSKNEILSIFSMSLDRDTDFEEFDISKNNEEGAILLAISIILQGNRSVGQLTELLSRIQNDISNNGKLDDENILNSLRTSTIGLDFKRIRENIESRYKELNNSSPVPDFERQLSKFLSYRDYPLTITIVGEGEVEEKIVTNPSGREYPYKTVVELTPIPKEGWVFESWGGDLSGNETPKQITVDGDKTVTVTFKRRDYPLNLTIEGEGTVEERIVTNPNGKVYPFQTIVELTPVPAEGWVFESWGGDLTGTETPQTITVDKEKNVTVKFKRKDYKINFTIEGEGTVEERIVTNPNGRLYPFQTVVELTPIPSEGWVFESWGGDLSGSQSPTNLTIKGEMNVTVVFKRRDYPLNLTIEGEGTVEEKIVTNPNGRVYPFQTIVELTPVPAEGWVFDSWGGDLTGTETPQTITVDKEKNVTVKFKRKDYKINFTIEGEGTVDERIVTNPNGRLYPFQTVVELTPVPAEGWVFESWGGDLSGTESPTNLTIKGEMKVTVVFKRRDYPLNLTIEGEGTVEERIVTNPNGRLYPFQTIVELTPVPSEGWIFDSWGGDLSGTEAPQNISVDKEKNVTVKFKRKDYKINFTIEGEGTVEERIVTNPNGRLYPFQTVVELTPVPAEGWVFESWGGDLSGSEIPQSIIIDKERNVTVVFRQPIFRLGDNGVTCICENVKVGEKGFINGVEYEAVDNSLLRQRRDQGVDMSKLCTSLVTNMYELFINSNITHPIGNWDVSKVTRMGRMFLNSSFNQPIGNWNVGNVTNMEWMFENSPFNQPIGNWDVSNVKEMYHMFQQTPFNQPIGNWDVGNVMFMWNMFHKSEFNQPIGNWNVSNVTRMMGMFKENSFFNQPLENWDVSNVKDMNGLFWGSPFNQNISNWCVKNIWKEPDFFSNIITPENKPVWGTCPD